MADPVLHIKDSYYFEVPKVLYPYDYGGRKQFPDVWITLDPEFQDWEFTGLYRELSTVEAGLPKQEETQHQWHEWRHHDHANFAKPYDEYLEEKYQSYVAKFNAWKAAEVSAARAKNDGSIEDARRLTFGDYIKQARTTAPEEDRPYLNFLGWRNEHAEAWQQAKVAAGDVQAWRADSEVPEWSEEKIAAYNGHLSGKILIPQPFGTLRNLYERESGFAISKYMIIELAVGLIILLLFAGLARRIASGKPAKGKLWNLLEVFLVFIRDQIAKPILGEHDHGHDEGQGHESHAPESHGHAAPGHAAHGQAAAHAAADPVTRFLPLLWTMFFFVLGCNLMGMVPWAGSPTAAFAVTGALALVTFLTVFLSGMVKFGVGGFFLNQIPNISVGRPGNPLLLAVAVVFELLLKAMILVIEIGGLAIKNGVLAVRLLANMVAGHLVILGVMGLAFGAEAALKFTQPNMPGWLWGMTAVIAVVASAAFSVLELFVAFLQAYIFTFLTALFIGTATHKH